MSNPINVKLSTGHVVTMRPLVAAQTGNEWHSATKSGKALSSYGVTIKELKDDKGNKKAVTSLPATVSAFGRTFKLETGKSAGGFPKVGITADVNVEGQTKTFKFTMSDLGDGTFNLTACKLHGKGGRKKGQRLISDLD